MLRKLHFKYLIILKKNVQIILFELFTGLSIHLGLMIDERATRLSDPWIFESFTKQETKQPRTKELIRLGVRLFASK